MPANVKLVDKSKSVVAAVDRAAFKNFGHAAAAIRKTAQQSIDRSREASLPGEPPHTRGQGRHNLRAAIVFDRTSEDAVVGPRASIVGQSGSAHEFGGRFKGQLFDERPFMEPALNANLDRFARQWAGSVES